MPVHQFNSFIPSSLIFHPHLLINKAKLGISVEKLITNKTTHITIRLFLLESDELLSLKSLNKSNKRFTTMIVDVTIKDRAKKKSSFFINLLLEASFLLIALIIKDTNIDISGKIKHLVHGLSKLATKSSKVINIFFPFSFCIICKSPLNFRFAFIYPCLFSKYAKLYNYIEINTYLFKQLKYN